MADRGITFVGDLGMEVGSTMPQDVKSGSLSNGGPIEGGPSSNPGMTCNNSEPVNYIGGSMSTDGPIQFAGE